MAADFGLIFLYFWKIIDVFFRHLSAQYRSGGMALGLIIENHPCALVS